MIIYIVLDVQIEFTGSSFIKPPSRTTFVAIFSMFVYFDFPYIFLCRQLCHPKSTRLKMDGTIHTRELRIEAGDAGVARVPYVISCADGDMWYPVHALYKAAVAPWNPLASKAMLLSALRTAVPQLADGGLVHAPPMVRRRLYKAGWIKSNVRLIRLATASTVGKALWFLGISDDVVAQINKAPTADELSQGNEEERPDDEGHNGGCMAVDDNQESVISGPDETLSSPGRGTTYGALDATVGFKGLKMIEQLIYFV